VPAHSFQPSAEQPSISKSLRENAVNLTIAGDDQPLIRLSSSVAVHIVKTSGERESAAKAGNGLRDTAAACRETRRKLISL
jgi:hypothetical protein